jgi:hypothetical protein
MTRAQERAVAAMRAIGGTVTGAPPLRLPPQPAAAQSARWARPAWSPRWARSAGRAWRLWLVPAGAAIAVVTVAVSLVLVRSSVPKESAAAPGAAAPGATVSVAPAAVGPDGVPQYYVALPQFEGWYAYAPLTGGVNSQIAVGLVIGSTATGKQLATVAPPDNLTFNVVAGAADDRTFIVGATSYSPSQQTTQANWSESWYLLRISSGQAHVAQLTKLLVPAISNVTGVAISPDGTELAVAYQQLPGPSGAPASGSPELSLWSVATGKALRHWGTLKGQITASTPTAKYVPDALDTGALAAALRWTPDGRDLAFAWNGSEIRLLNLASQTSRQGDLGQASTLIAGIGPAYAGSGAVFTCDAADGWALSTGATTFTCAGSFTPANMAPVPAPGQKAPATGAACGKAAPAHLAFIQQTALSGGATELSLRAESATCISANSSGSAATLGWVSPDGSKFIGMLQTDFASDAQYGIFTEKKFTKLPPLPSTVSLTSVAW